MKNTTQRFFFGDLISTNGRLQGLGESEEALRKRDHRSPEEDQMVDKQGGGC